MKLILEKPGMAPRPLAGKSETEALAYLKAQKDKREQLQARVSTLGKQREDYLAKSGPRTDGFDEQVVQALRERAAKQGIQY